MRSSYQTYLDHLASCAECQTVAIETERNIYPLFTDIKNLIGHYQSTISKFSNVQEQLVHFIGGLEFDDEDFDFYQNLFLELRKIDGYLQELKSKQVPSSISNEVQSFIVGIYSTASLYKLKNIEEQVLSYHNKTAEVERYERYENEKQSRAQGNIVVVVVVLIIILIIAIM